MMIPHLPPTPSLKALFRALDDLPPSPEKDMAIAEALSFADSLVRFADFSKNTLSTVRGIIIDALQ